MIQGTIYIISAPSGAGKSCLIKQLMKDQLFFNIHLSISHTTRAIRPGELNGKHYFFVSVVEFERMIADNKFIEYAKVFDNYYGTSREKIQYFLTAGRDIFLDIDWRGAQQIRNVIPTTCSIFILPPSKKELIHRLYMRGQDSKEIIDQRMKKAVTEMKHFKDYDYLIVNDDFNAALTDLKSIVRAEQLRINNQKLRYNALINKLLS